MQIRRDLQFSPDPIVGVLTGLVSPSAGRLVVDGVEVGSGVLGRDVLRPQLRLLPQRFGFFPGFTVREFLEYAAWLRLMPRGEVAAERRAVPHVRVGPARGRGSDARGGRGGPAGIGGMGTRGRCVPLMRLTRAESTTRTADAR